MKETIEALTTFANTVRNNKFGATSAIVLLGLLIFGMYLLANVSARVNHSSPPPEVEAARFARANKATEQINDLLDAKIESLHADRAGVRQFHNGKTDLSGLPFMYVSTTFVRTREGVSFPESNFAQVPGSTVAEVTSAMWRDYRSPKCITVDVDLIENDNYRAYSKNLGVEVFFACPITNLRMYPIGFMFVSYIEGSTERPSDEEAMRQVAASAERISGYLSSVTKTNRKWWEFWKPEFEDKATPVSDPVK